VSLFFEGTPRVVVQGITGREARMVVRHMATYGTRVAAGVTPGKGGETVEGVPVFDTIASATFACGSSFDVSLVSVPPLSALDAIAEAVAAGIRVVIVATENVPLHDAVKMLAAAGEAGTTLIGPNSVGVISPGARVKLGAIGGELPERVFAAGRIGIMSRSGGLTAEVGVQLKLRGLGVSTAVSVGGDAMIGTSPADLLRRFAADDETDAVVYVGEPGTRLEEDLAAAVAADSRGKPLVAVVLGAFMEDFPEGTAFGHAGAIIENGTGTPTEKMRLLADAGALVAESFDDVFRLTVDAIGTEVRR
jgi:succinyl-CoA synthetase alpha subunit